MAFALAILRHGASDGIRVSSGGNGLLAGHADVTGFGAFEDVLGSGDVARILGVNRDEHIALTQLVLVATRLDFRNAQTDEAAGETADRGADGGAAESRHDRARRDERTDAGDGQGPNARKPAEGSPNQATNAGTGGGAFRSLGVHFVGKIAAGAVICEQGRDIVAGETSRPQIIDNEFRLKAGMSEANDRLM